MSSPTEPETPSGISNPALVGPKNFASTNTIARVGKYRVLAELGRGGMANVYLAVAHGAGGVNKLVVLKALLPDLASEPYALSMFLDEARLAAQLNHPNVVQTYEIGTEGDRHVMVMEYLEGQSLWAIQRRGAQLEQPLAPGFALRILISTLEGLHYAHELRSYDGTPLDFVHRDISPQNIFVTYTGQVKVLDFGIAKAASSSTHTQAGIIKGKVAYMAPEQALAETVDRRADIYSVGCLLWGVAAGRKLWKDMPDVQIMRRVISGEIPTPKSVNPDCDDELDRIVMKALQLAPADRYQTALDFQQDLEAYCESRPQPKQKDLARYVSHLFAETRTELKALIESRLAFSDPEPSAPIAFSPVTQTNSREAVLGTPTGTGASSRGRSRWLWLAAAIPLLIGGALKLRHGSSDEAAAHPIAEPSVSAHPAVPQLSSATVQFRVRPAQATLFLDDEQLPPNLASKVLPVDGHVHRLRAQADGFEPAVAEFSPVPDAAVELELKALPASEPEPKTKKGRVAGRLVLPVRGGATAATPPTSAAPAPTPERKHCDEPFYITPEGIRKLRPECM